jgi:spore coat protein H
MRAMLSLMLLAAACGSSPGELSPDAVTTDAGVDAPPPGQLIFDFTKLHRVDLTISPADFAQLNTRENDTRVPCDIKVDDLTVLRAGVKLKGLGSWDSLDGKPSFSIKLNEFVSGQTLDGEHKILLNNEKQDPTFLHEHIGYAAYRAMNLPGPLSSYAWVLVNGKSYGLYVLREAIAADYLKRNFGPDDTDGNLYEGFWHPDIPDDLTLGDFAVHPEELTLHDEVSEARSRADVYAFKNALATSTDATFAASVALHLDLARFQTQFAIDGVLGSQDTLHYFTNNYYLYHHVNGLFEYIPGGMDRLRFTKIDWQPTSVLSAKIIAHPTFGQGPHDDAVAKSYRQD